MCQSNVPVPVCQCASQHPTHPTHLTLTLPTPRPPLPSLPLALPRSLSHSSLAPFPPSLSPPLLSSPLTSHPRLARRLHCTVRVTVKPPRKSSPSFLLSSTPSPLGLTWPSPHLPTPTPTPTPTHHPPSPAPRSWRCQLHGPAPRPPQRVSWSTFDTAHPFFVPAPAS